MSGLSHFDEHGQARMVDVGDKAPTVRYAKASASIRMQASTLELIRDVKIAKGDVLQVARLAGIMASKRTPDLIPLCHTLPLESVEIDFEFRTPEILAIESQVRVTAKTGAEMEALVSAATAALTVYDMCKSIDRSMSIQEVRLEEKSGGKSGHFVRKEDHE